MQQLLMCQDLPSQLFQMGKGVLLEMGDYMGHFMDIKVLSFQPIFTLSSSKTSTISFSKGNCLAWKHS